MGANLQGDPHHVFVKRSSIVGRVGSNSMMTTYYQHGADNLSIWLTNAKEAAAKIREATTRKRKEKREKYVKFLKDLHLRVAVSSKEKKAASSTIPSAKISCSVQAESNHINASSRPMENAEETKDLLKQASRMEDERSFIESQLRKKARSLTVAKYGDPVQYREFLGHKVKVRKEETQTRHKVRRTAEKQAVTSENGDISLTPIVKPFVVVIPTPTGPQKPQLVMSEPCTPRHPLDGWNIPTSFSSLDMRDVDEFVALASPTSLKIDPGLSNTKLPPLVLPSREKERILREPKTFAEKLSARRKVQADNARTLSRTIALDPGVKCCEHIRSKLGNADTSSVNKLLTPPQPPLCCGTVVPRAPSPYCRKLRRNHVEDASDCHSFRHGDGLTTCSMGVVVLKGREEYENRGQGKQFFSDVWKCTMDAERRYASERARLLSDVKKKRLMQLQIEKHQKAVMMKEKALTRQRVAVQTHLEMVESLKARREGVIKRNRILEKRR